MEISPLFELIILGSAALSFLFGGIGILLAPSRATERTLKILCGGLALVTAFTSIALMFGTGLLENPPPGYAVAFLALLNGAGGGFGFAVIFTTTVLARRDDEEDVPV